MKHRDYLLQLIVRYRDHACTPDEIEQLRQYLADERYRLILEELFTEMLIEPVPGSFTGDPVVREELDTVYRRILNRRARHVRRRTASPRSLWGTVGRWTAAASVLILATIGLLRYIGGQPEHRPLASQYGDDVQPADEHPVLTLADGSTIALNGTKGGIILTGAGITYADGTDVLERHQTKDQEIEGEDQHIMQLVLTTPKGRQFQVTLPDQTKVWLNAATTLRYPSRFGSDRRIVELDGEAYFDVHPLKRQIPESRNGTSGTPQEGSSIPFIVKTKRQTIQVLGTEFNVSAYPDEHTEQLTLVEGAVRVTPPQSSLLGSGSNEVVEASPAGILLTPGEQVVVAGQNFEVRKADIGAVTGWLNGRFNFDNKTFQQVMAELARWYDIEIVYEGEIPRVEFFGDAIRTTNLSTVLYLIESTKISYRIEDRKLIIAPKKGN